MNVNEIDDLSENEPQGKHVFSSTEIVTLVTIMNFYSTLLQRAEVNNKILLLTAETGANQLDAETMSELRDWNKDYLDTKIRMAAFNNKETMH